MRLKLADGFRDRAGIDGDTIVVMRSSRRKGVRKISDRGLAVRLHVLHEVLQVLVEGDSGLC